MTSRIYVLLVPVRTCILDSPTLQQYDLPLDEPATSNIICMIALLICDSSLILVAEKSKPLISSSMHPGQMHLFRSHPAYHCIDSVPISKIMLQGSMLH